MGTDEEGRLWLPRVSTSKHPSKRITHRNMRLKTTQTPGYDSATTAQDRRSAAHCCPLAPATPGLCASTKRGAWAGAGVTERHAQGRSLSKLSDENTAQWNVGEDPQEKHDGSTPSAVTETQGKTPMRPNQTNPVRTT